MAVYLGTEGPDSLTGSSGDDSLQGGPGADTLNGSLGQDVLDGGEGDDSLGGGDGSDTLIGGLGNDILFDYELDQLGSNLLQGGAGFDSIDSFGTNDTLDGGDDDDQLRTSSFASTLLGGAGNDKLWVGSSHAGVQWMDGGAGNDTLSNFADDVGGDTLDGGAGNDQLRVSGNGNLIAGGTGADRIALEYFSVGAFHTGTGQVYLAGRPDAAQPGVTPTDADVDVLVLSLRAAEQGRAAPEVFDFHAGFNGDQLDLAQVLDRLMALGGSGTDPFAAGNMRLLQDGADTRVQVDTTGPADGSQWLDLAVLHGVDARTMGIYNITQGIFPGATLPGAVFNGTEGPDLLVGGLGPDSLQGNGGNDTLDGGDGADSMDGGAGDDSMSGGAGRDTLHSGGGIDTLDGGDGDDLMVMLGTVGGSVAFGGAGADDITSIMGVNDTLDGGAGNDQLSASGAGAVLRGGDGDDMLSSMGTGAWLEGGAGNDRLFAYGEQLGGSGGAGDDTIVFMRSAGILAGGTGADLFRLLGAGPVQGIYLAELPDPALPGVVPTDAEVDVVEVGLAAATVYDFHPGAAGDVLDFAQFVQRFAPVLPSSADLFQAGVLRFTASGADTLVESVSGVATTDVAPFQTLLTLRNVDVAAITTDNLRNFVAPAQNHPVNGTLTIDGTLREGETLTAVHHLLDVDGIPADPGAMHFQWFANGVAIPGATASTFALADADVGNSLRVQASYTDLAGYDNAFISEPTGAVENVNASPTGSITLAGPIVIGQQITASGTLQDGDGLGTVRYQWIADGVPTGVEGGTLAITKDYLGQSLQVLASYTDGHGTFETVTSAATEVLAGGVYGRVYQWKTHALVAGVQVAASDGSVDTTSAQGAYQIASAPAAPFTLSGSAPPGSSAATAITSADALAALRIAVGSSPNADPDGAGPLAALQLSPYQVIAADVNGDGRVSSADALAILRMAVKAVNAPFPSWDFVDERMDLWDEAHGASALTRTASDWTKLPAHQLQGEGEGNLVAVLRGDVNGSWSGPAGTPDLDALRPGHIQQMAASLGVPMDVWGM